MSDILLKKAGEKVELQLDGSKVAVIENNNPHIGELYVSDNDVIDKFDVKLKYKEKILATSNVFLYHLNPKIKGRIKLEYLETTNSDKILKDFGSSGGGGSSQREMTLISLKRTQIAISKKYTDLVGLQEEPYTNRHWFIDGVFTVRKDGFYNIKLSLKLERRGSYKSEESIRLIDSRDNIIGEATTNQSYRDIATTVSIDKTARLQRGQVITFQVYQTSTRDLEVLGKDYDTFGSIEFLGDNI